MPEAIPGYLRIRVVNRSPLFYFADGFENAAGMTTTWWHSLGTEAGTDNSINYWTQVAGVWTYAAHILTAPATAPALIVGGHADWTDMTYIVRVKWTTGSVIQAVIHCDGTDANSISAVIDGTNLVLSKRIASVNTTVATIGTGALVNNTFYWLTITALGTAYSVAINADTGPGSFGTVITSTSGTVADAGVQSGVCGIRSNAAVAFTVGGAFANVCNVTGTGPDGTQGQAWTPQVGAGEPAFAWSKVSPYSGTRTASIYNRNSNGSGIWAQVIRLFAGTINLSAVAKASAGFANVAVNAVATGGAGTTYAPLSATGAVPANPTVSCNYSGAVGTAYFDVLSILNPAYEITTDLPHLHQVSYTVPAFQPGNPGSSAIGTFTAHLHPPGSEAYAASRAIYDQLDYGQRIEMYEGYNANDIGLGKLVFAGIITGIDKQFGENSHFILTGVSDMGIANLSRPFPGELLSVGYGSGSAVNGTYRQTRNYFGTNEPGWVDSFNPYTAANYTSVAAHTFGGDAGTWSATTDEGQPVVACSTGASAGLLSKVGARSGDMLNTQFVEITGRLLPSTDATDAGEMGVGLSTSNVQAITGGSVAGIALAYVRARWVGASGTYNLDLYAETGGAQVVVTSALTNVGNPEGYIPLTISIQTRGAAASGDVQVFIVTVNGQSFYPAMIYDLGQAIGKFGTTCYPFLFSAKGTGAATSYFRSLVQQVRYTDDRNPGLAVFRSGSIDTPAHSLQQSSAAGPTFLEVWSRAATLEGWYWRYTPTPYVVGTRTLGTVDLAADPGSDLGTTKKVVFSRGAGNLVSLQLSANADAFAAGTATSSVSGTDGGGIAYARDLAALAKYGSLEDQTLAVTAPTFFEQRLVSAQVIANKVALGSLGSKTALVLRDADTADKWRELDRVMLHDPELGILYLVARVISYTLDEGLATMAVVLDQFSIDDPTVPARRLQTSVFQIANKFGNRA